MPDHPIHSDLWNPTPLRRRQPNNLLDDELVRRLLSPMENLPLNEQEPYPVLLGFYNRLLAADVLLPVISAPNAKNTTLRVYNASGDTSIPVFTSENTLTLWDASGNTQDADWVRQPFMMVCQKAITLSADFLLINMAGPYGCQISADDLPYLANGLLPPPADLMSNLPARKNAYTSGVSTEVPPFNFSSNVRGTL